jgi:hypothetical protein
VPERAWGFKSPLRHTPLYTGFSNDKLLVGMVNNPDAEFGVHRRLVAWSRVGEHLGDLAKGLDQPSHVLERVGPGVFETTLLGTTVNAEPCKGTNGAGLPPSRLGCDFLLPHQFLGQIDRHQLDVQVLEQLEERTESELVEAESQEPGSTRLAVDQLGTRSTDEGVGKPSLDHDLVAVHLDHLSPV